MDYWKKELIQALTQEGRRVEGGDIAERKEGRGIEEVQGKDLEELKNREKQSSRKGRSFMGDLSSIEIGEETNEEVSNLSNVHFSHSIREEFGQDKWYAKALPDVVVEAYSLKDVKRTLEIANKYSIPLTTRGAGVGYVGGCVPIKQGILLSLNKMNRILEINPKDGIVVVEPGVNLSYLQEEVRKHGFYYPPDPASLKECSIGGTIATNAGGPRCVKYGVTKNYVLGLQVVLADGRVLDTGGRCHKNKTGFDLVSMFVGSEGLLGVVTQITLKIIPHPQSRAMIMATFDNFKKTSSVVYKILEEGWLPSGLEITDSFTLESARAYAGDFVPDGNCNLMLEIDGREDTILDNLSNLSSFIKSLGACSIKEANNEEECEKIWNLRREFSYSLRATGLTKLNQDIVVPRSKLEDLVNFAQGIEKDSGIKVACFGHAGDGNIHVNLMIQNYNESLDIRNRADEYLDKLFTWVIDNKGAITGEHGVGIAKKKWFKQAVGDISFDVHRDLKNMLDPKGILNPSKFLD